MQRRGAIRPKLSCSFKIGERSRQVTQLSTCLAYPETHIAGRSWLLFQHWQQRLVLGHRQVVTACQVRRVCEGGPKDYIRGILFKLGLKDRDGAGRGVVSEMVILDRLQTAHVTPIVGKVLTNRGGGRAP